VDYSWADREEELPGLGFFFQMRKEM